MASLPERLAGSILAATMLLIAAPALAESLYCCKGDRGGKICADRLPKQCIGKPHTIRDGSGRTTRVEGFLSPGERKAREAEEQKKRDAEEVQAERQRQDRALLATYGNVRDIDNAHERAREDVAAAIAEAERRVDAATKRRAKYDSEAEFYKKKAVPAEIKRGIRDSENEIKSQTELIELKRKELDSLAARFADERERYLNLTVRKRSERLER
jgi:hypothetical protein